LIQIHNKIFNIVTEVDQEPCTCSGSPYWWDQSYVRLELCIQYFTRVLYCSMKQKEVPHIFIWFSILASIFFPCTFIVILTVNFLISTKFNFLFKTGPNLTNLQNENQAGAVGNRRRIELGLRFRLWFRLRFHQKHAAPATLEK
jgi:hypothetical protein